MAQFAPPQFMPPQSQVPSSVGNEMPNIANIPRSSESGREAVRSVPASRIVRATTQVIISSREEFVRYLKQSGLDLLTSWVDFEQTKDFIMSSYIVYPQQANTIEKLADFLNRYPQLKAPVEALNQRIKQGSGG